MTPQFTAKTHIARQLETTRPLLLLGHVCLVFKIHFRQGGLHLCRVPL